MIVNEQLLDGSIEAFAVGVHFRVFRVGEVVSNLVRAEGFLEVWGGPHRLDSDVVLFCETPVSPTRQICPFCIYRSRASERWR